MKDYVDLIKKMLSVANVEANKGKVVHLLADDDEDGNTIDYKVITEEEALELYTQSK